MLLFAPRPQAQLAERLDRARELGYSHVKSRLMRGRLKNRIETLRGDVGKLSKEELKQYLRDANLDDGGDKEELVAKLRGAWKRSPGLKAAAASAPYQHAPVATSHDGQ